MYDVTPFLEEHPGGDEVLILAAGKFQLIIFLLNLITCYCISRYPTKRITPSYEWLEIQFWIYAEKDATDDFETVGHSLSAIEQMEKYYIGNIDMSTVPKPIDYRPPASQSATKSAESSGSLLKVLQILVPLLILGVAFYLQFYGKKQ